MVGVLQLSKRLPQGKNRLGPQYAQRKSFLEESHNIKAFLQVDLKVKPRNNIDTTLIISKKVRLRLNQKEEIDHRVRLEKQVASKAVDLLLQPVKDLLGIPKPEVLSHLYLLQTINLISTNGTN